MTCTYEEKLTAYLFDELSRQEREDVEKHLETCETCREVLTSLKSTVGVLQDSIEVPGEEEEEIEAIIGKATEPVAISPMRRPVWMWLPAAAAIVIAVIAFTVIRVGERGGMLDMSTPKIEETVFVSETEQPSAQPEAPSMMDQVEVVGGERLKAADVLGRTSGSGDDSDLSIRRIQGKNKVIEGRREGAGSEELGKRVRENEWAQEPKSGEKSPQSDIYRSDDNGLSSHGSLNGRIVDSNVTSNMEDFEQQSQEKVQVESNKNTKLDTSKKLASEFGTKVVVTGQAPVVDATRSVRGDLYSDSRPKPDKDEYREKTDKKKEKGDAERKRQSGVIAEETVQPVSPPRPAPPEALPTDSPIVQLYAGPTDVGGSVPPNGEPFPSMFFEHAGVNPFIITEEDPLSTFAVDVDTASYNVTRSYLRRGYLPPSEAVRVEEFVNAFPQGYPAEHNKDWAVHIDGSPSPFGEGYHLLRIGLVARSIPEEDRRPVVLTFVIDVSGSMNRENRLQLVKKSLRLLVDRLDPRDSLGIAVYGSRGQMHMRHMQLTHENREEILAEIERLHPGGSTNAAEGISIGYRMASEVFNPHAVNRVILCSDGVANTGQTRAEQILKSIKPDVDRGIFLTTIGYGMGNYNDTLMEKLANKGNGMYTYIDTYGEAESFFLQDLTGLLETVAKDTKIQVEFNPKTVQRYRLLGYENRDVKDKDFRNDRVDAGEVNSGHTVVALYEVKLSRRGNDLGVVRIRHKEPMKDSATEISRSINRKNLAKKFQDTSTFFKVDSLAAQFAEILRGSYWARDDGGFSALLEKSKLLPRGKKLNPQIVELVTLIRTAERITVMNIESGDITD